LHLKVRLQILGSTLRRVTFPDGSPYTGAFKDSKINGQGTYTFPNGDTYTGEFKDGEPAP